MGSAQGDAKALRWNGRLGVGVEVLVCRGQDGMASMPAQGNKSRQDWGEKHVGVLGVLHGGGGRDVEVHHGDEHVDCGRMRGRLKLGLTNLLGSAPEIKITIIKRS